MKTNVSIELTDCELSILADQIDGKPTQRKATRKEINSLCLQHIGGLANSIPYNAGIDDVRAVTGNDIYTIDPGDRDLMSMPDNPGYVRGWNTVKRGAV